MDFILFIRLRSLGLVLTENGGVYRWPPGNSLQEDNRASFFFIRQSLQFDTRLIQIRYAARNRRVCQFVFFLSFASTLLTPPNKDDQNDEND